MHVHSKHVAQAAPAALPCSMTEERKSVRVQLLLSPSELAAIDDWRFANRIGSRGEAIRVLTRAGLGASARAAKVPSVRMKRTVRLKGRARRG